MASVRQNQEPPRPFYCHHCSHQWLKAHNSLFECPRCREGFIEEVSDDFNPNVNFFPAPPSPLGSLDYILEAISDRNEGSRSRANRGIRIRSRAEASQNGNSSRSRSPHISNIVIGTSNRQQNGNDLQLYFQRRNNAASRFLSVALDDILSFIFTSERRQGLTQEQLESIPVATITNEQVQAELQCAICFEDFQLNENEVRKLLCNHFFHEKCIFPWLESNPSCPVCRTSLSPNNQSDSDDDESEVIHVVNDSPSPEEPSTSANNRRSASLLPLRTRTRRPRRIERFNRAAELNPSVDAAARVAVGSPISSRTRNQSRSREIQSNNANRGFRIQTRQRGDATRNAHPYVRPIAQRSSMRQTPFRGNSSSGHVRTNRIIRNIVEVPGNHETSSNNNNNNNNNDYHRLVSMPRRRLRLLNRLEDFSRGTDDEEDFDDDFSLPSIASDSSSSNLLELLEDY